jgi:Glutathione S-transferase, C-terminal domain
VLSPQHASAPCMQLYEEAVLVIKALNARAEASEGAYLLGKKPTELDAKAYGILAYILAAPTVAPVLKDELNNARALRAFLNLVAQEHFAAPAPTLLETADAGTWSAAAAGAAAPDDTPTAPSPEDLRASSNSKWWLAGVGALVVGYILFGGHYVAGIEYAEEEDEREREREQ